MRQLSIYPAWRRTATPLFLAFVSLLAAVALWVAVTDAENPRREADFAGTIEIQAVNIPDGLAIKSITPPTVRLRVSADEDTYKKLTTADFRAVIDLSGVDRNTSDQSVITSGTGKRDVEIISGTPSIVTVVLEPEVAKQVPVQVNRVGVLPQGYNVTVSEANPDRVRVTGASSLVQLVQSVAVDVNLTGTRVTIQQQYPLVARDSRGADIRGVQIEPGYADVKVTIVQLDSTQTLTVEPQIQGGVADGYNLIAVVIDPPAVTVSGPLEALQALSTVRTEAIDASGLRGDTTRSVRLTLPARLQANRDSVTVTLKVAPIKQDLIVAVAPEVSGLGEGLTVTFQTTSVSVRLRGDAPILRNLPAGAVKVTVNVAGLSEGVHVLQATVTVPGGLETISVDPLQVVVVLRR
ncbi:MAG TPA: CdaR family protein [Dehalococcoidia bacterium]|nr:CdaR family protein [Dehalococcoidia bacterium]